MRIAFFGHLSLDTNVVRGVPEDRPGGGSFHGAITALRLGAESIVVTKCRPSDIPRFSALAEAGVETVFLPSLASTAIRNDYPADNPDDRVSVLVSAADPFCAADLDAVRADVYHVNPLWFGEFPPALLLEARRRARVLGADAQGFLRQAGPDGRMTHRDWADKAAYLGLLDVFKVDLAEARTLTGFDDPRAASLRLHELGARIVLLTHRDGVCVRDRDGWHEAAFGPYPTEGRTGRGDTCTAAFLVGLDRGTVAEATRFAAEVTTRKMQYPGPLREWVAAGPRA